MSASYFNFLQIKLYKNQKDGETFINYPVVYSYEILGKELPHRQEWKKISDLYPAQENVQITGLERIR